MWFIWLLIALLFFIIEIATALLVSVWFTAGAIVAFILAIFGLNFYVQISAFVIISIIVFSIGFHYRGKILPNRQKIATNADRFIGKEGIVEESFNPITGQGRAIVNGISWRIETADGNPLPAGTLIVVNDIAGTRLIVSKKEA